MKLDNSYIDTWITRQAKLNGLSYSDYLKSKEWQLIRRKAYKRPHLKKCYVCGSTDKLELHHRSYNTIGTTDLRNVRAVCRTCHQAIHDYSKQNKISVRLATKKYRKLYLNSLYT